MDGAKVAFLSLVSELTLVGVFAMAALSKLHTPRSFAAGVRAFRLLPNTLVPVVSGGVISMEFAVVGLTLIGLIQSRLFAVAGLAMAGLLLVAFSLTIAILMRSGTYVPCRCVGASDRPLGLEHLIRNVILMILVVAGIAGSDRGGDSLDGSGVFAAGTVAIIMTVAVRLSPDLIALATRGSSLAQNRGS
jgi:hypothetical protein